MIPDTSSRAEENAELQRQLATANERLERAQSVIFALHCSVARKDERGLWMREKDRSGLRAAVWEETEDLGDWQYIKAEDVPKPTPSSFTPLIRSLFSELGFASSLTLSLFSKSFPPELFYHIIDYSSQSTLLSLCLVSSSIRAIASPRLYETMVVTSASELHPFLPNPLAPLAPFNPSLTLHRVLSLDMTVPCGRLQMLVGKEEIEANIYNPMPLPRLRHLTLRSEFHDDWDYIDKNDDEVKESARSLSQLVLAADFLSHLNPQSFSLCQPLTDPDSDSDPVLAETIDILQSTWTQSTSKWDSLKSFSFVDVTWLNTFERRENGQPRDYKPFSPSDLPACNPSMSLSWTFSETIGGYAQCSEENSWNPLEIICGQTVGVEDWPFVREFGFQVEVGDGQEDRAALEDDIRELPEKWRGRVHYRGDGRSGSKSGSA